VNRIVVLSPRGISYVPERVVTGDVERREIRFVLHPEEGAAAGVRVEVDDASNADPARAHQQETGTREEVERAERGTS